MGIALPVGVGMAIALVLGARFIEPLLEEQPVAMRALFLGLVLAGTYVPAHMVLRTAPGARGGSSEVLLARLAFAGVDADEAGARLLASRTSLLHRLRELSEEDWAAQAEHDTFGPMDIEGLMLQVLAHDEEHRDVDPARRGRGPRARRRRGTRCHAR